MSRWFDLKIDLDTAQGITVAFLTWEGQVDRAQIDELRAKSELSDIEREDLDDTLDRLRIINEVLGLYGAPKVVPKD